MIHHRQQNSIELIEDCLDRIYRSRKANLISKSRKFKEKQSRNFYDKYNNDLNHGKKYEYEEEEYNLSSEYVNDGEVLEELSNKFKAPPIKSVPYEKERSRIAIEYEEQDIVAETAFEEFKNEIKDIIHSNALRLSDDEYRADICDDLIDKYLTRNLDRCIGTRIVSKIRKKISVIIEYIASTDNAKELISLIDQELNPSNSSSSHHIKALLKDKDIIDNSSSSQKDEINKMKNEHTIVKNVVNIANKDIRTNIISNSNEKVRIKQNTINSLKHNNSSNNNDDNIIETSKEERQQLEKKRIKTQYEQLMNLKKKSENHPDDDTIDQYNSLHADIQSVIDSISTSKKPLK